MKHAVILHRLYFFKEAFINHVINTLVGGWKILMLVHHFDPPPTHYTLKLLCQTPRSNFLCNIANLGPARKN